MKPSVKVEIISLFIFLCAYLSLLVAPFFFESLLLISLGFMSYLCFFVEFVGKFRAHKAVAFEHASFGFFIYLLPIPILYVSNIVLARPGIELIRYLTLFLILPVVVSKLFVSLISIKNFEGLGSRLLYLLFTGILIGALVSPVFSVEYTVLFNLFFILVSSTPLLRAYNYFGIKLRSWLQISLLIYVLALLLNIYNIFYVTNINTLALFSFLLATNIFLFESILGARYMDKKRQLIERGLKLAKGKGYVSKVLKRIDDRYNVSLTLLAHDIVDSLEKGKKLNLKALKIV
jgi:hypothetical protein